MRRSLAVVAGFGLAAFSLMAVSLGWAAEKPAAASKEIVWPADKIQFKPVIPGVSKAVLWGDPDKGPYGALTKFAKGTKNALHTHTHDIKIVVISGTMVSNFGGGEKKLGPGSYVLEPAGAQHTNGAGEDADCLFFEESDGPFDLHWMK